MKLIYRSKVDAWLGATLIGISCISLGAAYFVISRGTPGAVPLAILLAAAGAVLPVWLLVDTKYVFDERSLLIRGGPFWWRIPLRDIRKVEPTRSPLSSPALSLDRLKIDYGVGRSCLVSPRDRPGFVAEIKRLQK